VFVFLHLIARGPGQIGTACPILHFIAHGPSQMGTGGTLAGLRPLECGYYVWLPNRDNMSYSAFQIGQTFPIGFIAPPIGRPSGETRKGAASPWILLLAVK
jgi:hypothetical protein